MLWPANGLETYYIVGLNGAWSIISGSTMFYTILSQLRQDYLFLSRLLCSEIYGVGMAPGREEGGRGTGGGGRTRTVGRVGKLGKLRNNA